MATSALIVGLGRIGMGYDLNLGTEHVYSHARALSGHPAYQLVATVDPDAQQRRRFTEKYGAPSHDDLVKALERHHPELVVIAAPTESHGTILRTVLEHSAPRAILCEKPLSYDVQEAQGMVAACAAKSVRLYVNYMRRSDPGVIEIKRRIVAGELAQPIKGSVWYSKGLIHNGSHFVNLLEYWLGAVRSSVVLNRGRARDHGDSEPDFLARFEGGSVVFQAAWEEAFSHHAVELLSPSGRLRYEQGGEVIQWQPVGPDPHFEGYRALAEKPQPIDSGMRRYQWHVADQLGRALAGQDAHLCTGIEALGTLETMKRILTST